jgi:hypothetical protein
VKPKSSRSGIRRVALIAASIEVLVLVAAGWTANRVWSKWRQPAAQEVAQLEESEPDDADVDVDLPPAPDLAEDQADETEPEARLASGLKKEEETESVKVFQAPARPAKAAAAEDEPRPAARPALVIKRRKEVEEEALRKQLLWAPEVGVKGEDVSNIAWAFNRNEFHLRLDAAYILHVRPDFKTLPLRRGPASRVDQNASRELQALGRELHVLMDQRAAAKTREKEPSTVLLAEFMKLETRQDKKPNWLRPEAVPTLQQILGHEDLAVRLMLVDLLAQIDGRASSVALVQHAVFDLSSEVRDAAIKALDRRPREQYRSALIAALRYPWAPAADHAAEALVALKDRDAPPLLVRMLTEPDPADPVVKKDLFWKREVVRMRHLDNCVVCHPPANGTELVQGAVPGFAVVDKQKVVSISVLPPSVQSTLTGGGSVAVATTTKKSYYESTPSATSAAPFTVSGDITYLRQDFSIEQPALVNQGAKFADQRFDYLVRCRPLTDKQTQEWKAKKDRPESYEQRDAVLFALRELTGQDAGPTTEAWQKLYPTSEFEEWTQKLTMALVDAPDLHKLAVIRKLRDGKGTAYSEALAQAIPQLAEPYQPKARAALVERMKRMSQATLRDKLAEENREIRLAAATAAGLKEDPALVPDLTALLEDADPEVAEAAQASIKSLGGAR